jgi:hypothetical protein
MPIWRDALESQHEVRSRRSVLTAGSDVAVLEERVTVLLALPRVVEVDADRQF